MNKALIYRPNNRKLTSLAFACAITIHLGAIALAGNKSKPVAITWGGEPDDPVIGTIDPTPQTPEPELVLPPEPNVIEDQEFTDETVSPPIRSRKKAPMIPIARSIGAGATSTMRGGSVKALTLYAPRPAYPYEARLGGITGSGIAELTVNPDAGIVIEARMAQSTGSVILDNATLETLWRWRFKPGTAANIQVPITFMLTGVSY